MARLKQIREGVNSIDPGWWPDQKVFSASFLETLHLLISWTSQLEETNDKWRIINQFELERRQARANLERDELDAAAGSETALAHTAASKAIADAKQAALAASVKSFEDWRRQKVSSWSYRGEREKLWKSHNDLTKMIKERFGIKIKLAEFPSS